MRLIDGDDLKDFFFRPESGTEETINDLMMKHNLDYLHDVNEDDVMDFAKELLHMVCNVIDTQQTAYDIDKVVEELKDLGSKYCINVGCEYECKDCPHGILMQKEIEIVKQEA